MAARRLIIVLVLLFAVSIAAAAIAPERRQLGAEDESSTTTTTAPDEDPSGAPAGGLVEARIRASAAMPETVRAKVGDQLVLDVAAGTTLQVEIQPLGLLAAAAEGAPARFDLLLREPGALPLTDALTDEVIGRVLVTEAGEGAEKPRAPEKQGGRRDDPEEPAQQPPDDRVEAA